MAALEGEEKLPTNLKAEKKARILERAHSAIMLSLADEVLREVVDCNVLVSNTGPYQQHDSAS